MADGPHFTYFPTLISLPESVLPLSSGDGDFGNEIVPTQERSFDETSVTWKLLEKKKQQVVVFFFQVIDFSSSNVC